MYALLPKVTRAAARLKLETLHKESRTSNVPKYTLETQFEPPCQYEFIIFI